MGESLLDTLYREVREETGYQVLEANNPRIYDVFVQVKGEEEVVHHVFALYEISLSDQQEEVVRCLGDELNDALGPAWVGLNQLSLVNASPLILTVKKILDQPQSVLVAELYEDWLIKPSWKN